MANPTHIPRRGILKAIPLAAVGIATATALLTRLKHCASLATGASNSFSQAEVSRYDTFHFYRPARPSIRGGGAENTKPFGGIIPLILCELLAPAFGRSSKPSDCGNLNCSTGGL